MSNKATPIIRHVEDSYFGTSFTEITFPGWCNDLRFGPCAYKFRMHQQIDKETVIEMAKTLGCILEIESNEDLEVIDY